MPYDTEETWEDGSNQWDDDEYGDDEDEEPTIFCPNCRAEIWEEAERCPECGEYISDEARIDRRTLMPRWIMLTAILCLLLLGLGMALSLGL